VYGIYALLFGAGFTLYLVTARPTLLPIEGVREYVIGARPRSKEAVDVW